MDAKSAKSPARAIIAILAISGAVFVFLIWLIYFKETSAPPSELISVLPTVNAFFNATSSVLLTLGLLAIRRGERKTHQRYMTAAMISSAIFLISYVIYHNFHGDTPFPGQGLVRPVYFFILITHIVLSAAAVPLILTAFYLGLSGRYTTHRKVAKITFPIWLYVSVTGVLIYIFLQVYR